VADEPYDTKTTLGRDVRRDVRCYAAISGSVAAIESIAERVRTLLHRHALVVDGYVTWVAQCSGPILADEEAAYGRVVTVRLVMMESDVGS
jgi:hypothetical protein